MERRVVLAGGRGFIGRSLADQLVTSQYEVVTLSRVPREDGSAGVEAYWDGKTVGPEWAPLLDGADAVVNLAGKNVACRHTPENREALVSSRVDSVRAISAAIQRASQPPKVWVQAGSLAIYGDPGGALLDETAVAGGGFAAEMCKQWEAAFNAADTPGTRKVLFRTGMVLGPGGDLLVPLQRLARAYLGGALAGGSQYVSWIHAADLNRMVVTAIETGTMHGIYNATGPSPVTNADFMATLRHMMGRPWCPSLPAFAVHLACSAMGLDASLLLTGRRCRPRRFQEMGFVFQYSDLDKALYHVLEDVPQVDTSMRAGF
jgi:uncharacterized protein (TIGR01777 family)